MPEAHARLASFPMTVVSIRTAKQAGRAESYGLPARNPIASAPHGRGFFLNTGRARP